MTTHAKKRPLTQDILNFWLTDDKIQGKVAAFVYQKLQS